MDLQMSTDGCSDKDSDSRGAEKWTDSDVSEVALEGLAEKLNVQDEGKRRIKINPRFCFFLFLATGRISLTKTGRAREGRDWMMETMRFSPVTHEV